MKAALRGEVRERLERVTPREFERAAAEIAARLWSLPELAAAGCLLVYAPLPGEVPTRAIVDEARRRGITVAYPRALSQGAQLALHRVDDERELGAGRYGILEPGAAAPELALGEIDVALVPGLAWDRRGFRLGRGAGYYDRFLARPEWRGFACGLFLAAQEIERIPAESWDVPLDAIVTEREVSRGAAAS